MIRTAHGSACLWSWGVWKKYHFPSQPPIATEVVYAVGSTHLPDGCLRFGSKCQLAVLRWCIILYVLCESTKHLYTYTWKPSLPDASTFPCKKNEKHANWGCLDNYGFRLFIHFGGITWIRIPSCLSFLKGINDLEHKTSRRVCQEWAFHGVSICASVKRVNYACYST